MEAINRVEPSRMEACTTEESAVTKAIAKRRRFAREFVRQLIVWAVTCSFLAVVNWLTSPHYWWVLWVIAGWGLQLLLMLAFYLFDCDEEASPHNELYPTPGTDCHHPKNNTTMEEKRLDAQESIELITRMIRNTRQRLERHSGRPFLIWGYTTVAVSLLNYILNIVGADPEWGLTWFLIPVLGVVFMRLFPEKKSTEPRTEIDRIVSALWIVCSLSLIPIFILCLFHGWSYRPSLFALITLVMSIGTAATGRIVRSKIYTAAGFLGMVGTAAIALWDFYLKQLPDPQRIDCYMLNNEILIFAAIFFVMMVIPGHIINYRTRHGK